MRGIEVEPARRSKRHDQPCCSVPLILLAPRRRSPGRRAERSGSPFYLQPGLELEQSARNRFIDPARKILNQNDEIRQGGADGCLDPALPFNDTDYDPAEVARTLKLYELVKGDQATVLATFMADRRGERRRNGG